MAITLVKKRKISLLAKIYPLAPSVNKARLSDAKEVKKWLKRNFKDVFLREGTAEQKGDVLYYIMSK